MTRPRSPRAVRFRRLPLRGPWRRLVEEDARVYPAADRVGVEEYVEYRRRGLVTHLMVEPGGDWIGVLQVWPPSPERDAFMELPGWAATTSYVAGLTVFAERQRQGWSASLMDHLDARHGHAPLSARVRKENVIAQRVVRKAGFEARGEELRDGTTWFWFYRAPRGVTGKR